MAFGLYVDPIVLTQRHTLYDSDEEENETEQTEVAITASLSDSKAPISEGGTLLVAVGLTASIFAKSYPLLVEQPICSIVANSQTVLQGKYFPLHKSRETAEKVCDDVVRLSEVYAVKSEASGEGGNCFVCAHEKPLKPEYCNVWASKVFECLHPATIIILTSRPSQEHFSPHVVKSDPCCMLRCLQSSSWSQSPLVPTFLEPPNTIAGEAAAILTHCQVNKLPASLVVLYTDSTVSTSESMSALQTVLKHPSLSQTLLLTPADEALLKVKQLTPKPRHDLSTLYT